MSELSEITFRNTTEDGCEVINAELKQLEYDCNALKLSTQMAKENVQRKLYDWVDLWKKAELLSVWVRDMELKLGSYQEYGKDLIEKKLLLDEMKVP